MAAAFVRVSKPMSRRCGDACGFQSGVQIEREHARLEHTIALFVRDRRTLENGVVSPYVFLGPALFVSSTGDRPVVFTWRLETPMPEELFEVARTVGAA